MRKSMHPPPRLIGLIAKKRAGKDTLAASLAQFGYQRIAFADKLYAEVADTYSTSVPHLNDPELKQTPQQLLALSNCADPRFVQVGLICGLAEAGSKATADDVKRFLGGCASMCSAGAQCATHREIEAELHKPRSPRWTLQKWGTEYRRKLDGDRYWLEVIEQIVNTAPPSARFVITDCRFLNEVWCVYGLGGVTLRIRRKKVDDLAAIGKANGDPDWCHPSEIELDEHQATAEVENREGEMNYMACTVFEMFGLAEPELAA
jgi:hypothetical protein